jgi:hypothetical protein
MHNSFSAAALAGAALLFSAPALADPIELRNSDFSQGLAVADGDFVPGHAGGNPTHWSESGGSGTGHWNPTSLSFADEAAHGGVAWVGGPIGPRASASALFQTVLGHTIQANTRYTLTLDVGRRLEAGDYGGYDFGLLAGSLNPGEGVIVARSTGTTGAGAQPLVAGMFETLTLVWETGRTGPEIGKALGIMLGASGRGMAYDNVRLDATSLAAVPEPANWAMMIGGFGIAGGMVRRRRLRLVPAV